MVAGICAAHAGSPSGDGLGTYDPDAAAPALGHPFTGFATTSRGNAYQARKAGRNSLVWLGVPFDPPGPRRTRILRITNVRLNVSELAARLTPIPISVLISTDAANVFAGPLAGGGITLPLLSPAVLAGSALPSLEFRFDRAVECRQCESSNLDFHENNSRPLAFSAPCENSFRLRFSEGSPGAFRTRTRRDAVGSVSLLQAMFPAPPTESQDTFDNRVQYESGFYKAAPTAHWPEVLQNGSRVAGAARGTLGLADHGTRLAARFTNVPDGVQVWVANTIVSSFSGACQIQDCFSGRVTRTQSEDGEFSFPGDEARVFPRGVNRVRTAGGAGLAVWEVVRSQQIIPEAASIPVIFAYRADPSANLFPFVTNAGGLDTGLAIANTSKGPFGEVIQTGSCQLGFFGTVNGSPATLRYATPEIAGGEHFVWSLSGGGAVPSTPGFQGYVIADCSFQYGNGFAFVHAPGSGLATAHLGLVLDGGNVRTGALGERLGR